MAEDKEPAEAGRPEEDEPGMSEDEIDLNLVETFPASDPPSWTLGTDHRDESPDTNADEDTGRVVVHSKAIHEVTRNSTKETSFRRFV